VCRLAGDGGEGGAAWHAVRAFACADAATDHAPRDSEAGGPVGGLASARGSRLCGAEAPRGNHDGSSAAGRPPRPRRRPG